MITAVGISKPLGARDRQLPHSRLFAVKHQHNIYTQVMKLNIPKLQQTLSPHKTIVFCNCLRDLCDRIECKDTALAFCLDTMKQERGGAWPPQQSDESRIVSKQNVSPV
jgi:hypothetical protein